MKVLKGLLIFALILPSYILSAFAAPPSDREDYDDRARESIERVIILLDNQETLPFGETLTGEMATLKFLRGKVSDQSLISRIDRVLERCEDKKLSLEKAAELRMRQQKAQEEEAAKQQEERIALEKKRQEEEAALQQQAQKKRTIWMVIGGILLSAVTVGANQVLQHFRNIRNQKSMLQMQEDMIRKAENEAKAKARSATRSATRKVTDEVISKVDGLAEKDTKKRYSI